jgi:hypothetical protein
MCKYSEDYKADRGHSAQLTAESVETYAKYNFPCEWYKNEWQVCDKSMIAIIREIIPRYIIHRIILAYTGAEFFILAYGEAQGSTTGLYPVITFGCSISLRMNKQ